MNNHLKNNSKLLSFLTNFLINKTIGLRQIKRWLLINL
jgi:hypothetical protein